MGVASAEIWVDLYHVFITHWWCNTAFTYIVWDICGAIQLDRHGGRRRHLCRLLRRGCSSLRRRYERWRFLYGWMQLESLSVPLSHSISLWLFSWTFSLNFPCPVPWESFSINCNKSHYSHSQLHELIFWNCAVWFAGDPDNGAEAVQHASVQHKLPHSLKAMLRTRLLRSSRCLSCCSSFRRATAPLLGGWIGKEINTQLKLAIPVVCSMLSALEVYCHIIKYYGSRLT